jgi:RNase adaptor protein for sRNA GlmZ degradation
VSTVKITSFGYLHDAPPQAHVTLDLRAHFRDPHVRPELRHMTARDLAVREAVLGTPGIVGLIGATSTQVRAFRAGPTPGPLMVAVGCAGGRRRGVDRTTARHAERERIPRVA